MKKQELAIISHMRLQEKTASEIACALKMSVSTVRSHIRRHPEVQGGILCRNCGKAVPQPTGRKEKRFCSDKCGVSWWNSHQAEVRRKAFYRLICQFCGKEFESYGNTNRKYCCRECYLKSRKSIPGQEAHSLSAGAGAHG